MKSMIVLAVIAAVLWAGCTGQTAAPQPQGGTQPVQNATVPEAPAGGTNATTPPAGSNATGEGNIIEAPSGPGSGSVTPPTGNEKPATSQQDCATLTPTCGTCIAIANCGWCKASNSCLYGNASGPLSGQCQPADWATTSVECEAPASPEGMTCGQQTNCAFCLSGSGCKWCIQGTKCVPADSTESCFGGWLTESFQCNYASR